MVHYMHYMLYYIQHHSITSEALQADREIVLAAVKQNRRALKYASEALKADSELEFEAAGGAAAARTAAAARRRRRRRLV